MEFTFMDIVTLIFSLAFSIAIVVPLTGALVRFRANYNPKGLHLDAEGTAVVHTGPVISSYIGMLRRIHRIEGMPGMYKGLMPTLLSTIFIIIFMAGALDDLSSRHGGYRPPTMGIGGTLVYGIFMMVVQLPVLIITYRAITTPHKLPYFSPIHSLRVLLTSTERSRPWVLYLTPGLMATQASHISYVVLALGTFRRFLLPYTSEGGVPSIEDFSFVKLSIYIALVIFSTILLAPLEVIATRLAIQRNHSTSGFNSVSQVPDTDAEEATEYAGADEDVIGLRSEEDPYVGMLDCAKRIVDEEGWRALYRAWWLTLLGGLGGGFA